MKNNFLIDIALSQIGIKETVGQQDNPEVLKYFYAMGMDGAKLKDETAWCSSFMNWVAIQCNAEHTRKLNARSWLNVGQPVKEPIRGDIVVLWREDPSSWKGHVGLFIHARDGFIYILGGNQSNKVGINAYRESRVLEYRRI